jgi:hypothetical protein
VLAKVYPKEMARLLKNSLQSIEKCFASINDQTAFKEIRKMLSKGAVLHHPDYVAASVPWESGRPFEIFVDASDYGWSVVLCQRPKPHAAPKIICILAKAFSDTQLRWSATRVEFATLRNSHGQTRVAL